MARQNNSATFPPWTCCIRDWTHMETYGLASQGCKFHFNIAGDTYDTRVWSPSPGNVECQTLNFHVFMWIYMNQFVSFLHQFRIETSFIFSKEKSSPQLSCFYWGMKESAHVQNVVVNGESRRHSQRHKWHCNSCLPKCLFFSAWRLCTSFGTQRHASHVVTRNINISLR